MDIRQMRSELQRRHDNKMGDFPNAPDWAVRRIFEKRNGLTLTKLPAGIEVRSSSSIVATYRAQRAKVIVQPVTDEADRDMARLRLAIALLQ